MAFWEHLYKTFNPKELSIHRIDYKALEISVQKVKDNELKPFNEYHYKEISKMSDSDKTISKLLSDIDFKPEFKEYLFKKGYKRFKAEFIQYKNLKALSEEKGIDIKKVFFKLINGVNESTSYGKDELYELFRYSKIFNNLSKRDFYPKLKEWVDVKINYSDKTYQMVFPINELTTSSLDIVYPTEYLSKEELFNTFGLKYKTIFKTDNIESFFKSLKEYTKTKGLNIEQKKMRVGNGGRLYKYLIN